MKTLELVGIKSKNSLEIYVNLDDAVVTKDYYDYQDYNLTVFSGTGVVESFLVDDTVYEVREGQLFELIFSPCGTRADEHITLSMLVDVSMMNNL